MYLKKKEMLLVYINKKYENELYIVYIYIYKTNVLLECSMYLCKKIKYIKK